ncbi:unnamed protein product [Linum tenue]|uniref:LOB domain-containing protein n=1 Tax=Linum tenue TaxID=586396 RepID=A0AAV0GSW4_9ROSI|nr:unnamed protein product [Linum tenue]
MSSSSSSQSSPCAACKFLRRKCTAECVFAPYFPPDQPAKFASVHRVFGASNVAKLLNEIPAAQRDDAANSLAYEAEARFNDPVYGCVASNVAKLLNEIPAAQRDDAANSLALHLDLHLARQELDKYIGPQSLLVPSPNFGVPGNPSSSTLMIPPQQQQINSYPMMGIPTGSGLPVMIRENNTQLQQQFHHRLQLQEAAQQQQRQFQQQEVIRLMDGGVTATGFNEIISSPSMGVSTPSSSSLALGEMDHDRAYQGQQVQRPVVELKPQLFLQQQHHLQKEQRQEGSTGPSG